MLQYRLYIVGTVKVKIEHSLLVLPGTKLSDIKQVYSHEQALHQCSDFLKAHPSIASHPFSNTAASAKFVAEQNDPSIAAIGSLECAECMDWRFLPKHRTDAIISHDLWCLPESLSPIRMQPHQSGCPGQTSGRCPLSCALPLCRSGD